MENNDRLYTNLISFLKMFKNRPYHLAKYLVDNDALTDDFIRKITESEKLGLIGDEKNSDSVKAVYFVDINQMNDFFNSLTEEGGKRKKPISHLSPDELNQKLDQYLKEERYEDAIRIRDYMNKHNIKRN